MEFGITRARSELVPHPVRFDNTKGREIAGLPIVPEGFSRLETGRDYDPTVTNESVVCGRPVADFFYFINPTKGEHRLDIVPPHWRSITEEDVDGHITLDADHSLPFYAVNTKGAGFMKPSAEGIRVDDYDTFVRLKGDENLGLAGASEFDHIVERTMALARAGLRSEVFWGVGFLKKIIFRGERKKIRTLVDQGVITIKDDSWPYMGVRVMKCNGRIQELDDATERRSELFQHAIKIFNREIKDLGLDIPTVEYDHPETHPTFFKTFASRLGHNVAVLLNTGVRHGNLHSANISLAAEVLDLTTVQKVAKQEESDPKNVYRGLSQEYLKDMRDMVYSLNRLLDGSKKLGVNVPDARTIAKSFLDGFSQAADEEAMNQQGIRMADAQHWMEKIVTHVIIKGLRLPSLKQNTIDSWSI